MDVDGIARCEHTSTWSCCSAIKHNVYNHQQLILLITIECYCLQRADFRNLTSIGVSPFVNDRVAWSVGLSVGVSSTDYPAENSEAIEIAFAFGTWVGPGKLLHITDRFGRILHCVHLTQCSLLV